MSGEQGNKGSDSIQSSERPLLEVLIDDTINRYRGRERFFDEEGRLQPYLSFDAARDTIDDPSRTLDQIFTDLTNQTSIPLTEIVLPGDGHRLDWIAFKRYIAEQIILGEIDIRHPDLTGDDDRREKLIK